MTTRKPRPWLQGIDYLTATDARGYLWASTCDTPVGFGERFAATMRLQGLTVTRYTPAQLAELRLSQGHAMPRLERAS